MIKLMALLMLMPLPAQAGAWEEFQARCLTPYESMFPPITEGLQELGADADRPTYLLPEGGRLVIDLVPDGGFSACYVVDPSGQAEQAFDRWIKQAVAAGRYEKMGENLWYSYQWIEPVVALSKRHEGDAVILQILETDLDS
jgi:hypothetical protein